MNQDLHQEISRKANEYSDKDEFDDKTYWNRRLAYIAGASEYAEQVQKMREALMEIRSLLPEKPTENYHYTISDIIHKALFEQALNTEEGEKI